MKVVKLVYFSCFCKYLQNNQNHEIFVHKDFVDNFMANNVAEYPEVLSNGAAVPVGVL